MADIVMPRLSDTMEDGTILRWLKRDGDRVSRGEELVEIETDKAAMTYESDSEGVLEIVAREGETLPVGQVIALLRGEDSEPASAADRGGATGDGLAAAVSPPSASAPAASRPGTPAQGPTPAPAGVASGGAAPGEPHEGERVRASPLARRIARERGLDLHRLTGSGPGGRVVRADVEGAPAAAPPASVAAPAPSALAGSGSVPEGVATAKGETTVVELTRTQQTIARRMAESKATIPDFSLQIDVDMEACVELRSQLKRLAPPEAEQAAAPGTPTYNDMVVKACALALREHPRANGSYRDGRLQLHSRINVGVAVAAEQALVVPTVFDADEKSLGEIARETRTLAERVRAGTITPPELGGGTFTVSNLGMYGVRSFSAIINPPQAAILSVGELAPRPVLRDGEVTVRHLLTLTLVCDHRILYGAEAARFGARVRDLLQAPPALTL